VIDPASSAGIAGPAVCANGALVYHLSTGEVLHHAPLAPDVSLAIIAGLRSAVPDVRFAFEIGLTFAREPGYEPRWLTLADDAIEGDAESLAKQPVTKLLVRHPECSAPELLSATGDLIAGRAEATYSSPHLLEISAAGVTKASGLAALCRSLGVGADAVLAFGDMPNDQPLLEWSGWSVAVANAHPAVISLADETTASNADDGVALVLERLAHGLEADRLQAGA
jgi:hydroxymethylpyrimidine pyrophosphatase-like HAD family hydrolase